MYHLLAQKDSNQQIAEYYTGYEIKWSHIPGHSTHFGGLWEAAVKAAKSLLHKLLGTQTLTWEEHYSILTEVEATLNSRPLYPLVSIRHFIHIHIMYFSSFIARVSLRPPVYHRSLSHRCWQCRLHYFCIFLWEAAVKAAKSLLHKLLGTQTLTWEEHYSILTEVEATLNSRPLYPLVSIRHFIHIHIMYFSSFIARVSLRPPVYHRSLSHRCWQCRLHYFCIFCFCLVSCIIFQLITVLFSKPILRDTHGMPYPPLR